MYLIFFLFEPIWANIAQHLTLALLFCVNECCTKQPTCYHMNNSLINLMGVKLIYIKKKVYTHTKGVHSIL